MLFQCYPVTGPILTDSNMSSWKVFVGSKSLKKEFFDSQRGIFEKSTARNYFPLNLHRFKQNCDESWYLVVLFIQRGSEQLPWNLQMKITCQRSFYTIVSSWYQSKLYQCPGESRPDGYHGESRGVLLRTFLFQVKTWTIYLFIIYLLIIYLCPNIITPAGPLWPSCQYCLLSRNYR